MRIHQATTTDNQANNSKDGCALTITEISISSTATRPIAYLSRQLRKRQRTKGGSYDYTDANDLGVPHRTDLGGIRMQFIELIL